jgi:hypothetical protein
MRHQERALTRLEAKAFARRWQRINEAEIEELRAATLEQKLRQLAALMASVDAMGWREALSDGVQEVRDRWRRLRMLHDA